MGSLSGKKKQWRVTDMKERSKKWVSQGYPSWIVIPITTAEKTISKFILGNKYSRRHLFTVNNRTSK